MPVADTTTQEIWKAIPSYEGRYEVSSFGRVRGLVAPNSRPRKTPRIVKCYPHPKPPRTLRCALSVNYKSRHFLVHRLVLLAFVGQVPDSCEGSHKDGDWRNNRLDNLCWETHADNEARKQTHGTRPRGRQIKQAKLTEAMVREARERYRNGERVSVIEKSLPVSHPTALVMLKGTTWKHVKN